MLPLDLFSINLQKFICCKKEQLLCPLFHKGCLREKIRRKMGQTRDYLSRFLNLSFSLYINASKFWFLSAIWLHKAQSPHLPSFSCSWVCEWGDYSRRWWWSCLLPTFSDHPQDQEDCSDLLHPEGKTSQVLIAAPWMFQRSGGQLHDPLFKLKLNLCINFL